MHSHTFRQFVPHAEQTKQQRGSQHPNHGNGECRNHRLAPPAFAVLEFESRVKLEGRAARLPKEPRITPMAIPAASQKIQLPASSATSAPAIRPNTTPSSEIFFFIAFSITVDNSLKPPAG